MVALIPLLLLFVFQLLFQYKHIVPSNRQGAVKSDAKFSYTRFYFILYFVFLISAVTLFFVFMWYFDAIWAIKQKPEGALFEILPHRDFRLVNSMVLSAGYALLVIHEFANRMLGNYATDFWKLYNSIYRIKAALLLKIFSIVLITSGTLYAFLIMDTGVTVYRDHLVVNELFSISERSYSWSDVSEIKSPEFYFAPNGERVPRKHYILHFKDGTTWSSIQDMRMPEAGDPVCFRFIADQAGLSIQHINNLSGQVN